MEHGSLGERGYVAYAEMYEGPPPERNVLEVLGVSSEHIPENIRKAIFTSDRPNPATQHLDNIAKGAAAFLQFQDILPVTIHSSDAKDADRMFGRHYAFYESVEYLRESVAAALGGFERAGMVLLRPFIELGVLQLYWQHVCTDKGYGEFFSWLHGKTEAPDFQGRLARVARALRKRYGSESERIERVRAALKGHYHALCAYTHSPRIDESLTAISRRSGGLSYESLLIYLTSVDMLIRQLVLLYTLTYPAILFPVELVDKFGFSPPVGLMVDPRTSGFVVNYLGEQTLNRLTDVAKRDSEVQSLMDWYASLPGLSELEIDKGWADASKDIDPKDARDIVDRRQRSVLAKAQFRAFKLMMNYWPGHMNNALDEAAQKLTDAQAERMWSQVMEW